MFFCLFVHYFLFGCTVFVFLLITTLCRKPLVSIDCRCEPQPRNGDAGCLSISLPLCPFVCSSVTFWPLLRVCSVLGACVHPKQLVVLSLSPSLSLCPDCVHFFFNQDFSVIPTSQSLTQTHSLNIIQVVMKGNGGSGSRCPRPSC